MLAHLVEHLGRGVAEAVVDVVRELVQLDAVLVDQPAEIVAVVGVGLVHLVGVLLARASADQLAFPFA